MQISLHEIPIIQSSGYEDPAYSNLVITPILNTRIHDITYQRYKYLTFSNERGIGFFESSPALRL